MDLFEEDLSLLNLETVFKIKEMKETANECYDKLAEIWNIITTESTSNFECVRKIFLVFEELKQNEKYKDIFNSANSKADT